MTGGHGPGPSTGPGGAHVQGHVDGPRRGKWPARGGEERAALHPPRLGWGADRKACCGVEWVRAGSGMVGGGGGAWVRWLGPWRETGAALTVAPC
jgi:hypothetical protein